MIFFATNHTILDTDLNLIPTYPNLGEGFSFNSNPTASNVLVGFDLYGFSGSVIQTISPENEVAVTTVKKYSFSQILSNPSLDQYFLVLSNITGLNIYSLNSQPTINNLINGTWHDPDIKNQGLVIQKGSRNNGSEYVFMTLFTYDQGEPLWLAGNADLLDEQQQLEITMYQFDGPQFLEYGVTPNHQEFGQLTLELENCNRLKVNVNSENHNKTLSLTRINDTSYDHLCADITTESLEEAVNATRQGEES